LVILDPSPRGIILSEVINFISEGLIQIIASVDDQHGIISNYGFDINGIINLCGGLPSREIKEFVISIKSISSSTLMIDIETDMYRVNRRIDFEYKIISNILMEVFEKGNGIGTKLFCNQVKEARLKGFRKIILTAMAPDGIADWIGYYCWARLGFQMYLPDHEDFMEMMNTLNRQETSIQELLESSRGRSIWLTTGFTWEGEFYLHDSSLNLKYLRNYLLGKNKDYGV
jgi:hypothetical protein